MGWVGEKALHTFGIQRIRLVLGLADVDDTVDIEGDFLAVGAPVLVAKAVGVFAVVLGVEAVVAAGYRLLVDFVLANGVCDLFRWGIWLVV